MKNSYIFLFLVALSLTSCKKEKKYKVELLPTDSITIPIDGYVTQGGGNLDYYEENGKKYLLYLTYDAVGKHDEFRTFDLDKKKLTEKTVFPVADGLGMKINGFNIIGKDSILVANSHIHSFYIISKKGKILSVMPYFYQNLVTQQSLYGVEPSKSFSFIYTKGKFYFSNPIHGENKKEYKEHSLAFSYDLKNKSITNLNFKFPADYYNSEYFTSNFTYYSDGKNIVYSPENSNDIWITDLEGKNYRKIEAKSDYFRHFIKTKENLATDMQSSYHIAVSNSYYKEIVYDKYRNVYYRFFSPGIDITKEDKTLQMKCFYPEKMSVIILDANFKKIGETVLPDLKYDYFSNFITEKGLWLYSNVDKSKNYKKDILKYTLLTLKNE